FVHHTNLEDATPDERRLVCYDCGVACDMTTMRQERLLHLGSLGAKRRPEPAPPPPPELSKKRRGPKVGDPNLGQRYRFRFEKKGPVALLGHLDLVRELPRVFRRLDVAQVYTGGFHPKPDMSFAPALSLGSMSLDEYVDLRLMPNLEGAALEALLEEMNRQSPAGLVFREARPLTREDPPIGRVITAARYLLGFAKAGIDAADPAAWLETRVSALLAAESLPMIRRKKGRLGRKLDIRPYLQTLAVVPNAEATWTRAGIVGDLVAVEATVGLDERGSARTREIAAALWGSDDGEAAPPHRCVRVALLGGDRATSPLHLEALRPIVDAPLMPALLG
ncbi:MAG: TIGR03936 family radical SAM-associated protein, partial [Myxococcales bacterium]|nr:TIGR03936 family radical SAM-associated protein [Myxococcales bacterium]